MNKRELRSILARQGDRQIDLAKYLCISEQTLSKKINEREGAEFSQTEIRQIKEKYNLNAAQVDDIFFTINVS